MSNPTCGIASTIGADQAKNFTSVNANIQLVDGCFCPKTLGEVPDAQGGIGSLHSYPFPLFFLF